MKITKFERGLQDRVAIVTGAAEGNGRAFCERLVQEGAKVVIADIEDASAFAKELSEEGAQVLYVRADLTKAADARAVAEFALSAFNQIDILVHNVGYYHEEPFDLLSFEEWDKTLQITLHSAFHIIKAVLPVMKHQGYGRIITFSSDTVWLGTPYLAHYVTAKMGIIGLTRSLASEVGKYGITINTVSVGLTATQNADKGTVGVTMLQHIIPSQSVHRADEPEDIANVVAFLALPASGIITGQTINVDGGVAKH